MNLNRFRPNCGCKLSDNCATVSSWRRRTAPGNRSSTRWRPTRWWWTTFVRVVTSCVPSWSTDRFLRVSRKTPTPSSSSSYARDLHSERSHFQSFRVSRRPCRLRLPRGGDLLQPQRSTRLRFFLFLFLFYCFVSQRYVLIWFRFHWGLPPRGLNSGPEVTTFASPPIAALQFQSPARLSVTSYRQSRPVNNRVANDGSEWSWLFVTIALLTWKYFFLTGGSFKRPFSAKLFDCFDLDCAQTLLTRC